MGLSMVAACAHGDAAVRPSTAEVRAYHYQDASGLLVGTYGASIRQPLAARTTIEAKAIADYVRVDPDRGYDPTAPDANRRAPDAVTSASATAGGGEVSSEWRFEGQLGIDIDRNVRDVPVAFGLLARGSTEPDYQSLSAAGRSRAELFSRNTAVDLLVGYGRDRVQPVEVFRGQEALWPATHDRWTSTIAFSQVLSPALLLTGGVAATWQRGTLSGPYRRAVVHPNLLLPETLPRGRDRYSFYGGLSISIDPAVALHLTQGLYGDSWGVWALIPQAIWAVELETDVLLWASYRFYSQTAASFYAVTYHDEQSIMTGDLRLGSIRDHTLSLDLRRTFRTNRHLALPISAGYQMSILDYRNVGARVLAHVFMMGVGAEY